MDKLAKTVDVYQGSRGSTTPSPMGGYIGETANSDIPPCDIADISVSLDIPQCDIADSSTSLDRSLDVSAYSDFLPYPNNHLHDDSLPEEENNKDQSI